ncbi:MAG: hypothetical protein J5905_05255, partial [Prevotella sp.]|nr:hypothetical protein [Prevotella sp.]
KTEGMPMLLVLLMSHVNLSKNSFFCRFPYHRGMPDFRKASAKVMLFCKPAKYFKRKIKENMKKP